MDLAQKSKADNWQGFLKGKGTKKKTGAWRGGVGVHVRARHPDDRLLCRRAGFFTGRKKESMFAVPEGGKVGVIGSGQGMTQAAKKGRHEFNLDEA
jgi:survival-of-motor-neuron-related-splicing factor 30